MTDPHYLKQEAYLRSVLREFTDFHRFGGGVGLADYAAVERFIERDPRSACVIIPDGKGNVLAVSRRDKPDDLGLPGGKLDPLERSERAAIRETEEETGVLIKDPVSFHHRVDKTDGRICACYLATTWSGEPRQREPGIVVKWVPFARLLEPGCTFAEYNRATLKVLRDSSYFKHLVEGVDL